MFNHYCLLKESERVTYFSAYLFVFLNLNPIIIILKYFVNKLSSYPLFFPFTPSKKNKIHRRRWIIE